MSWLLFVSQAMIDAWADQGKIDFQGQLMTLADGVGGHSYTLEPAVRFLRVIGAESDPNGLVQKVKSEAQVRARGGEPLGDSVVLGEVAYEVQPGFIAEASDPAAVREAPPALSQSSPADRRTGAQALARFLLENLS